MRIEVTLAHATAVGLLSIVGVGVAAMAAFAARVELPDAVLPAAIVVAALVQWRRAPAPEVAPDMVSRDRWVCRAAVLSLAGTSAILAWGALATSSRFWDGAAMWDLKARWLTETLSLEQPAFRDEAVYCHSRDYPLLQPVLVALLERSLGVGRILFPALYALQCGLLFTAMRRLGGTGSVAALVAVVYGATPMVMSPTSGGFDSGYADAFLALAVTATVAGLLVRDHVWLLAGITIGVLVKPEGTVYGLIAVVLAWLGTDRAVLRTATWSWASSLASWSVVQRDLHTLGRGSVPWLLLAVLAAFAVAVPAARRWLPTRRARVVVCLAVAVTAAIGFSGTYTGTWAAYVDDPARTLARLGRLPEITRAMLQDALLRGQFGLLFLLPFGVLFCRGGDPSRRVPWQWLVCMVVVVHLPFLLAPLDDLPHHLRSTMPRLLFHHLGVAALASGLLVSDRSGAGSHAAVG